MTGDFAPLSLKWQLMPGARRPGFRAADVEADVPSFTASASPDAVDVDRLMQAIATGATEDELVAVADGALTTAYHLLAQLAARRLLEVSVDFDGEVLCRLLPRLRDFRLPVAAPMPGRIVLDRFAFLRAGPRGATLQAPDAGCDIVAESAIVSALIIRLATAPIVCDDLQQREQRSLLALLVALRFARDADAPEPSSRRTWEFHDRLFNASSQLRDDGVARGATYRFHDRLAPPPAVRCHQGTEISLPEPRSSNVQSGRTLLHVMNARRSCRDVEATGLTIAELSEVLDRVGRFAVRSQGDDGREWLARPIPSAGGLQALEFYLATNGCAGLPAGFFHYRGDVHGLTHLSRGDAAAKEMLRQCARAWDRPDRPPPALVVLAVRLPRLAWKYEGIAYRLALLDAGVALQSLYLVTTDLGLAGAAVGASDPDLFAQASGTESWEETCVAAFGFGRPCGCGGTMTQTGDDA
jgi:oxazoline/thiazoline dehydrogenase